MTPANALTSGDGASGRTRDELWTLHKTAIEEIRFQVTLNWDRTKFYFLFNAALFTVAGGLTHFGGGNSIAAEAAIFALAGLNSFFAAHTIRKGHRYYRTARKQLKAVERKLKLMDDELALETTRGMVRETEGRSGIPFRERFTITNANIALQLAIGSLSIAAIAWLWVHKIAAVPR